MKDRQHLLALHKAAKKANLDLNSYNDIKREIAEIEYDLRRLRDPLYKNLALTPPKLSTYSATEIETSKKLKKLLSENKLMMGKGDLDDILGTITKRLRKKMKKDDD